jgi:ribosomal protein S18 acetylase RimI-like enzyme
MEALIGFARRGGFERIYLQTASRLAAAAHLYRSAGFEDTEPIHPHIPGRSDRAMALILRKQ